MTELAVISGKGGTGKTSVVASFAALASGSVIADCDVDAADLHLVLGPKVRRSEEFIGGKTAVIRGDACTSCGRCLEVCRFSAVRVISPTDGGGNERYEIDPLSCDGCGVCAHQCPEGAIDLLPARSGRWFVSDARTGPLVHARLGIGQENSGKLVTLVRSEARKLAAKKQAGLIITDGPPGIGCPVIASLTGADLALVVTEPSLSGFHDLDRVVRVARGLRVPVVVCLNKWDISLEVGHSIEEWCHDHDIPVVGLIPYDNAVTEAQIHRKSVVEHSDGAASAAIRKLWDRVAAILEL